MDAPVRPDDLPELADDNSAGRRLRDNPASQYRVSNGYSRNRHDAMRLANLDDRMLADIGLNRSDLRDAFAELPWRDPSEILARRAAERRSRYST